MTNFSAKLDRLKSVLHVSKDVEVAELLGLTKAALSDRKRRDAFPDEKIYVLAQQHPELALNVDYVLTGSHKPAQEPTAVDFSVRLLMELERLGMEHSDLAEATGLTSDTVLALANAERDSSPAEKNAIFKVQGIDSTFMLTGLRARPMKLKRQSLELDTNELRLIEAYRQAGPRGRAAVTAVLALVESDSK